MPNNTASVSEIRAMALNLSEEPDTSQAIRTLADRTGKELSVANAPAFFRLWATLATEMVSDADITIADQMATLCEQAVA